MDIKTILVRSLMALAAMAASPAPAQDAPAQDPGCAGGILYGQRNIPVILDFCKDIREVAEPGALFLNYANPMAMNTWAALQYGRVKTVGLCHGVQHGAHQIAQVLGVQDSELDYVCSGINHQTWYIDVRANGRRVEKDELIAAFDPLLFPR